MPGVVLIKQLVVMLTVGSSRGKRYLLMVTSKLFTDKTFTIPLRGPQLAPVAPVCDISIKTQIALSKSLRIHLSVRQG